jgi:chemotaxis protein CheX
VKTIAQSAAGNQSTRENWPALLEVAAREVFELMLGCRLTPAETLPDSPMDITSMVGLAGQLCGVLSVRCSKESSTIMASKMLGIEPSKVGAEMGDAFGEICNMVAGNFKNKISGLGDGCMLSVPTVIMGNDYSLHSLSDAAAIELRLLFENMPVQITLQIHS